MAMCLRDEGFEFVVQRRKRRYKVAVTFGFTRSDAHISARTERPTLTLDFGERSHAAESGNVGVPRFLTENFPQFLPSFVTAEGEVERLSAIKADQIA